MYKYGVFVYLTEEEKLPYVEIEVDSQFEIAAYEYLFGGSTENMLIYPFIQGQMYFIPKDKIKKIVINKIH